MNKEKPQDAMPVCECCVNEVPTDYKELAEELREDNESLKKQNNILRDSVEAYKKKLFEVSQRADELKKIANIAIGYVQQLEVLVENAKMVFNAISNGGENNE